MRGCRSSEPRITADVAAWLRGLGLEQYAPAFRDNDVDGEVLPQLTSDDLISIGVTSVGYRRKLLAAIAALGTQRLTVAPSAASATSAATSPPTIDAERRQLTVMFCDLVARPRSRRSSIPRICAKLLARIAAPSRRSSPGSTALLPSTWATASWCISATREHEDDAERAVRVGLGLIDAVGRLDFKSVELQARIGIATGLVVVGDLIAKARRRSNRSLARRPISLPGCKPFA
jgi:SAM domain (Sterile alpha motif)